MSRALHVVLAAQRVHATTGLPQVPREQREIDERHHAFGALHVFSQPKAVDGHRRPTRGVRACREANRIGVDLADASRALRRPALNEFAKVLEAVHTALQELVVTETLGDDHVCHRVEQGHIRPRLDREMTRRVGRQFDPPRIDHDQMRTAASGLSDAGADHRVVFQRVGATHENRAGDLDVIERVGREPRTEHRLEAGRARRVTDARTAVDVVRPNDRPRELLGEVVVFVRRTRGCEDADAVRTVAIDQIPQAARHDGAGFRPGRAPPACSLSDHWLGHAV